MKKTDCQFLEFDLKNLIGEDIDLAVRMYDGYMVIYVGNCQRKTQICRHLRAKGVRVGYTIYRLNEFFEFI